MLKNKLKNAIKDFGGIDELINHRQRKIVSAYVMTINDFPGSIGNLHRLKKQMPKCLRYGGYRNTCYDFRR